MKTKPPNESGSDKNLTQKTMKKVINARKKSSDIVNEWVKTLKRMYKKSGSRISMNFLVQWQRWNLFLIFHSPLFFLFLISQWSLKRNLLSKRYNPKRPGETYNQEYAAHLAEHFSIFSSTSCSIKITTNWHQINRKKTTALCGGEWDMKKYFLSLVWLRTQTKKKRWHGHRQYTCNKSYYDCEGDDRRNDTLKLKLQTLRKLYVNVFSFVWSLVEHDKISQGSWLTQRLTRMKKLVNLCIHSLCYSIIFSNCLATESFGPLKVIVYSLSELEGMRN